MASEIVLFQEDCSGERGGGGGVGSGDQPGTDHRSGRSLEVEVRGIGSSGKEGAWTQ